MAPWAFSSDFLLSPFGTVLLHLFPYLWNIDLSNWSLLMSWVRQISCTLLFHDIRQQHKKYLRARGRQKFPGEISFPPISLLFFVKMCVSLCFLEKYLFFCFPFSQLSQCVTLADKHDADGAQLFSFWLFSQRSLFLLEGAFLAVQNSSIGDIVTTDKDKDKDENKVALVDPFWNFFLSLNRA